LDSSEILWRRELGTVLELAIGEPNTASEGEID